MYYDNSSRISIMPKSATLPFCKMYFLYKKCTVIIPYLMNKTLKLSYLFILNSKSQFLRQNHLQGLSLHAYFHYTKWQLETKCLKPIHFLDLINSPGCILIFPSEDPGENRDLLKL